MLKCHICEHVSNKSGHMKRHIKPVHMHIKDINCEHCGKGFSEKMNLEHHIITVHKNIKDFRCRECGKFFSQNSNLLQHLKSGFLRESRRVFVARHRFG